jgi:hypothetical protein
MGKVLVCESNTSEPIFTEIIDDNIFENSLFSFLICQFNNFAYFVELEVTALNNLFRHALDEDANTVIFALLSVFVWLVVDSNHGALFLTRKRLLEENSSNLPLYQVMDGDICILKHLEKCDLSIVTDGFELGFAVYFNAGIAVIENGIFN